MSRGHGALQRQILELLTKHPEGAPSRVPSLPASEWTARELYVAIYWHNDPDAGEDRRYSLMASVRRALESLRAEGLITRTPSKAPYRGRGRVPWVWSLAPASTRAATAAARQALAANQAKRAQFKTRINGGRRLW
jgi:hypothetical protein